MSQNSLSSAALPAQPRLELSSVSKYFLKRGSPLEVLRNINLAVQPGEFVCIVGASGCGKTTLLRIVDGLEAATSGEILIDGDRRTKPSPDRAMVFQNDRLFPWRSVLKNVMLGLELQGKPRREAEKQARRYIDLVGLAGFETHYPHELSGGMRQRANLARAMSIDSDILLMDEPFASLDSQTREIMQAELLRVWREVSGRTVLFITHQIDEAIFLADRVVVLTARPGQVKKVIDVDLPRPRDLSVKRTPPFVAMVDEVWKMIEQEVKAGMVLTASSGHDADGRSLRPGATW